MPGYGDLNRRGLFWLLLTAMAALTLGDQEAAAEPRPGGSSQDRLRIERCSVIFTREIRRLLEIELSLQNVDQPPTERWVLVRCLEGTVLVKVSDGPSGRSLHRRLTMEHIPMPARARLVALTAAELTAILGGRSPAPAPAVKKSRSHRLRRHPNVSKRRNWLLAGAGAIGALGDPLTADYGGALTVEQRVFGRFGWLADIVGQHARSRIPLGEARAWLVSACAAFTASVRLPGRAELLAGIGGRLGLAHLAGVADRPNQVSEDSVLGAWAGPLIVLGLRIPVAVRWVLTFDLHAAYIALPVRGYVDGDGGFNVDGAWLLGKVGVGFSL